MTKHCHYRLTLTFSAADPSSRVLLPVNFTIFNTCRAFGFGLVNDQSRTNQGTTIVLEPDFGISGARITTGKQTSCSGSCVTLFPVDLEV